MTVTRWRPRRGNSRGWPVLDVEGVGRAAESAGLARKEAGTFGMWVNLFPFDADSLQVVVSAASDNQLAESQALSPETIDLLAGNAAGLELRR